MKLDENVIRKPNYLYAFIFIYVLYFRQVDKWYIFIKPFVI
jgi:hypothetical protein